MTLTYATCGKCMHCSKSMLGAHWKALLSCTLAALQQKHQYMRLLQSPKMLGQSKDGIRVVQAAAVLFCAACCSVSI